MADENKPNNIIDLEELKKSAIAKAMKLPGNEDGGVIEEEEEVLQPDRPIDPETGAPRVLLSPEEMEENAIQAGNAIWVSVPDERFQEEAFRDTVLLYHCYLEAQGSWPLTYFRFPETACLFALASTGLLEAMSEEEYDDGCSGYIGIDSLYEAIETYQVKVQRGDFLQKFTESINETCRYLYEHFPQEEGNPYWLLSHIYAHFSRRLPTCKSLIMEFGLPQFDTFALGELAEKNMTPIGVEEVSDNWEPRSFTCIDKDQAGMLVPQPDPDMELEAPDKDSLMLLELQCYAWNNRSWNKGHEHAVSILNQTMSYLDFALSDIPNTHPGYESDAAMNARLEELIKSHQDEDGNIALQAQEGAEPEDDGAGNMTIPLDAESSELMGLLQLNERNAALPQIINGVLQFTGTYLPEAHDNAIGLLADEGASFITDAIVNHGMEPLQAFQTLEQAWRKAAERGLQHAKSYWKGYLKEHPETAQYAKDQEWIVEVDDDGNPVFATEFFAQKD